MLAPAFLSYLACCRRTTPVFNGRRTTGKTKDITLTDEQGIHTPANMIIRCLGNNKHLSIIRHTVSSLYVTYEHFLAVVVIYISVIACVGETQTPKNNQLHLIKRFHHSAIAATKRISFLQGCKREESCGMVFSSNLKFNAASRIRTYAGRYHLISSQTP